MKKRFFISACLLTIVAIGFVIFAMGHPELSFPWDSWMTNILYGVYVDAVVLLFILAFCKKMTGLNLATIVFELCSIFFLIQSILTVFPTGNSNWYLPVALLLNCIGILLNTVQIRKNAKNQIHTQQADKNE